MSSREAEATIGTVLSEAEESFWMGSLFVARPGDRLGLIRVASGSNTDYRVTDVKHPKGGRGIPDERVLLRVYSDPFGEIDDRISRISDLHRTFTSEALGPECWRDFPLLPYQLLILELGGSPKLGSLIPGTGTYWDHCPFGMESSPVQRRAHDARLFESRVALARSFLSKVKGMRDAGWIHADINPPNLMVCGNDVFLTDFENGTSVSSGRTPRVIGKNDIYTPPEVFHQPLQAGMAFDVTRMDVASDAWSAGMLVSSFLFGVPPVMFFTACSVENINAYAASGFKWPDFDPTGPYVTTDPFALDVHRQLANLMCRYTPGLVVLYARMFQAVSSNDGRPTAEEWLSALDSLGGEL